MKLEKEDYDTWREHFLNALSGSASSCSIENDEDEKIVNAADAIAREAVEKQKAVAKECGRGEK